MRLIAAHGFVPSPSYAPAAFSLAPEPPVSRPNPLDEPVDPPNVIRGEN